MSAPGNDAERPDRIAVTRAVYDGLKEVQKSGMTNMLDRPRVIELAQEFGYPDAAAWVEADFGRYARAVFTGIRPDDMPEPPGVPTDPDPVAAALEQIAREEVGIETLPVRRHERLDIHGDGGRGTQAGTKRNRGVGA